MSVNEITDGSFTLVLCDPKPAVCDAFRRYFAGFPFVTVADGPFENIPAFDCMVSAGNGFGLMDGGVDLALVQFFGASLQTRVQEMILHDYRGEQSVGTCKIVSTNHAHHPFVAHAPTMRVPMTITRTDNVYLAFRAVLLAVHEYNGSLRASGTPIQILACSGLGTGAGQVPAGEAARQMALAYQGFCNPPSAISWKLAHERQAQIRYGGDFGFSIPPRTKG